ncbi:hypothetical protein CC79DRAFT_1326072 [Sarocladium strictum]
MASVTRQPFAPLNDARLQTLTSLKNRQNASPASSTPIGKRKAESFEIDSENVDPAVFSKRSKASSGGDFTKDFVKPANFVLTAAATPAPETRTIISPIKPSSTPRRTLQPKSPAAKLNTGVVKSSPFSVPAGRSPTRGKRAGLLSNRRRTAGSFARVDPPAFQLDSSTPFSLDAALKGTIPGYGSKPKPAKNALLETPDMKSSWFFDIHEDTAEQEMTNLLQHSTCVLDISSDEESERKATLERAEGRDKENVPPVDDVSQTSARRAPRLSTEEMVVEKERVALGEMNTADFYGEGCDEASVILVPADEDEAETTEPIAELNGFAFAPKLEKTETPAEVSASIDALMSKEPEESSKAAVLQPVEGTGESFELWESGSFKDESEPVDSSESSAPVVATS